MPWTVLKSLDMSLNYHLPSAHKRPYIFIYLHFPSWGRSVSRLIQSYLLSGHLAGSFNRVCNSSWPGHDCKRHDGHRAYFKTKNQVSKAISSHAYKWASFPKWKTWKLYLTPHLPCLPMYWFLLYSVTTKLWL